MVAAERLGYRPELAIVPKETPKNHLHPNTDPDPEKARKTERIIEEHKAGRVKAGIHPTNSEVVLLPNGRLQTVFRK